MKPPIPHRKQRQLGGCLPACGQMALERFGVRRTQDEIGVALGYRPGIGAPAFNVVRLEQFGVSVELHDTMDADTLRIAIQRDDAVVIVFVQTGELPTWDKDVPHAVVVTQVRGNTVTLYDPAFDEPYDTLWGDLLLAWDARGNVFAVMTGEKAKGGER